MQQQLLPNPKMNASGLHIVLKLLRDVLGVRAVRRSTAAYERRRDHGRCSWRIASMFSGRTALWCLYLAGVIALFVVTFINYVVEGFFSTLSGMLLTWAFLSFDLLCIAGLYAYLRSLVLFAESIWRILVVLLGIRLSFSADNSQHSAIAALTLFSPCNL